MSDKKPNYKPEALYFALRRVRRTANCIQGYPKAATGSGYVEAAVVDDQGAPVAGSVFFTMADRTAEQIEMLVNRGVIAPVPAAVATAAKK